MYVHVTKGSIVQPTLTKSCLSGESNFPKVHIMMMAHAAAHLQLQQRHDATTAWMCQSLSSSGSSLEQPRQAAVACLAHARHSELCIPDSQLPLQAMPYVWAAPKTPTVAAREHRARQHVDGTARNYTASFDDPTILSFSHSLRLRYNSKL